MTPRRIGNEFPEMPHVDEKLPGGLRGWFRQGSGRPHPPVAEPAARHGMGVAVVIVNHITTMPTQRHEVLPRFSRMPVKFIEEDLLIEPDHVCTIPSHPDMPQTAIASGCIDFIL
jgi:hypothetical protein